ncbi:unnamed protein product [Amoebophrya sp. A120]|nr:unnamed protein product [Amoebophrya sp. A120]|eukprot:GSA120T00017081001.1
MKMTDTALAGHVDAFFLTVTAFSDFYTQLYSLVTNSRVLGSLAAPAFGSQNYQLVGAYLQTALLVLFTLAIPVVLLNCCAAFVLRNLFDLPAAVADLSGYYAMVLSLCLPAQILMTQMSQFLVAQECADLVVGTVSIGPPVLNLLLGLQLVLGIPLAAYGFGFSACPFVTVVVEWVGLAAVFLAMRAKTSRSVLTTENNKTAGVTTFTTSEGIVITSEQDTTGVEDEIITNTTRDVWRCWPTQSVIFDRKYRNEIILPKVRPFLELHLPQVLSLSSDFWRLSAIGYMASWPSINGAGVFNAGYRIAELNMTLTSSLATAGNMLIGASLGRGDGERAQEVYRKTLLLVISILVFTSAIWLLFPRQVARVFATDESFLESFEGVSLSFSCFVFFMNLAVALESVLLTLKKSNTVLKASLMGSWLGQVPAVLLSLWFLGLQLENIYWGVTIGYLILCLLYWQALREVAWDREAELAQDFMDQ